MRFLVLVLGLAVVAYLGYRTMYGGHSDTNSNGTPKERLENVQKAATRIEEDQARAAQQVLEKSNSN